MGGCRVAVVLIAAGLAVYAAPASADPDDEIEMDPEPAGSAAKPPDPKKPEPKPAAAKDPKAAKKWVFTATQLVQKGDYFARAKRPDDAKIQYENALTAFQKAVEAGDDVNVYFELANVEDKLGKFDDAAKHWRVVVKGAGAGARADLVKKATAKFEDATAKVGLVTLVVNPDGAAIPLAGVEIGKSPLADPLILMPGTYLFSLAADGYQPKETELKVEAGSESERKMQLEPVKVVVEPEKPPVVDEPPEKPTAPKPPSKLPLYVGGGATIGLAAIATLTGVLAVGKHGTFTDVESSAGERDDAKSSGKRFALISDLTLVGALAAGGFTAYWYVFKYKKAQRKPATESPPNGISKVMVTPWVQPDTGGVTLVGSF